ncbi:Acetyl-CoA hydrolase [Leucoagaricus sp. SymC.cos]|nr:Acetyl-CoA hydrolase [Leucoagaricus sp. SymC.cos]
MHYTPLLRNVKSSPTVSAALKERVRHPVFLHRLLTFIECLVCFVDFPVLRLNLCKTYGDKKPLNWAVVEAADITEDGHIVPGAFVGVTPELLRSAEKIVIEVNTTSTILRSPKPSAMHEVVKSYTLVASSDCSHPLSF